MFVTSRESVEPDHSRGWGSQERSEVRWLLDHDSGGTRNGAVGLLRLEPGAAQVPHRHPGGAETSMVLAGSGTFLLGDREFEASEGSVLQAPAGSRHAVIAGHGPLQLLTVLTGGSRAADAGWEDAPEAEPTEGVLLTGTEQDEISLHDPEQGFLRMRSRWVVNSDICDSDSVIMGRATFEPNGAHELHKHTGAEEFFFLLEGEGVHLGESEDLFVTPGKIAMVPVEEWHGFSNTGDEEAVGVFGYLGTGKFEQVGYLLPDGASSYPAPLAEKEER
jgi:quercetin dioxygenase-like cupin family protein